MTAKEEDILTSANLIQKGIVLDKLLQALIVSEGVNLDDVLIGDKNAIMIASRILAYGKEYKFESTDPSNNEKKTHTLDLSKLEHKKIDFKLSPTVKKFIFNKIKEKKSHAREIKNLVKTTVQIPLSQFIVKNRKVEKISLKVVDKSLSFA